MNIPLILLWILLILLVVVFVIVAFRNIQNIQDSKNAYVLNLSFDPCYPNGDVNSLPSVPGKCCVVNGSVTTQQPFTIPSSNLNVLIDMFAINYQDICLDFCQSFSVSTGECNDSTTGTNPYATCLTDTKPLSDCIAASNPVAQKNGTPYYVVGNYLPEPTVKSGANCEIVADC
jgi:hypothetical protein